MHEAGTRENRRSKRFALSIPITVNWHEPNRGEVQESAAAIEASAHGGVLEMARFPPAGTEVSVLVIKTNQTAKGRIVRVRSEPGGVVFHAFLELLQGNENFWGIDFQLKKSTADLVELERSLVSGDVDARVLREFRDAVDYVRKAAWAVQEWKERQSKHRDTSTVLPLLTLERIRRASQLCKAITADVASEAVTEESQGVRELFDAIHELRTALKAKPRDSGQETRL